jgi:hypothetical protein
MNTRTSLGICVLAGLGAVTMTSILWAAPKVNSASKTTAPAASASPRRGLTVLTKKVAARPSKKPALPTISPIAPLSNAEIKTIFKTMGAAYKVTASPNLDSEFTLSPSKWKVAGRGSLALYTDLVMVGSVDPIGEATAVLGPMPFMQLIAMSVKDGLLFIDCGLSSSGQTFTVVAEGYGPTSTPFSYTGEISVFAGHLSVVIPVANAGESGATVVVGLRATTETTSGYFDSCRIIPSM